MRYISQFVFVALLASVQSVFAETKFWPIDNVLEKKLCSGSGEAIESPNFLHVGQHRIGLPFSGFELKMEPTQDGTFRAILLADSSSVISILIRNSSLHNKHSLKNVDRATPLGRVHFSSPLYSLSFGSAKTNVLYQSEAYGDYVVIESITDRKSIFLFHTLSNNKTNVEINIFPSVGCSGFVVKDIDLANDTVAHPVLARLSHHIAYFIDHGDWKFKPCEFSWMDGCEK